MRWLALTCALLAASATLVGWVYVRDRDTSGWRVPERERVRADARVTLAALDGGSCGGAGCTATLLGRAGRDRWLVRFTMRGRTRCLVIEPGVFAVLGARGIAGVLPGRCARGVA